MLIPLIGYLVLTMAVALWAQRRTPVHKTGASFLEEYFIGGRTMGGFVLP